MKHLIAAVALAMLAWLGIWAGLQQVEARRELARPSVTIGPVDCATFPPPVVAYDASKDQPVANVQSFLGDLIFDGFSVGTISRPIPACVNILIVRGLSGTYGLPSPYTAADAAAIKTWVDGGHALLLLGEWGPYAANTEAIFEAFGQAQGGPAALTDPNDYDPTGGTDWVIYQTDNFIPHAIVEGAAWIELLRSSWISPTASTIIISDADANPPRVPVMAAFASNQGCVVMVTDSDWVANATLLPNTGYFKRDNALVARQAVSWLQGCGQTPTARAGGPYTVSEGSSIVLDGSASSDPSGNALTYAWDLDDDHQFDDAFLVNPLFSAALRDDGVYTVSLRVSDGTYTDTGSTHVTVLNVAPAVFLTATALSVEVGAPITFTGSFTDPGVLDTHTLRWSFGDGTPVVFGSLIRSHTFNVTGAFTVNLTVADDDNGSGSATVVISVFSASLIANVGGPYAVNEGSSIALNGSSSIGATAYAWDLDNDGQFDDATISNPTFSAALLDDGVFPVALRVTNSFVTDTATSTVTVLNVAPQVSLVASTPVITVGQAVTFTGAFTDPGILDTHTLLWVFGDGSPPISGSLTRSHVFSSLGSFTTALNVTDDDGGSGEASVLSVVSSTPLAANAGGPYSVNEGSSILLDGSGSIGATTYAWDLDNDSQFDDATISNPTFSAALLDDGLFPVALRISNGFLTQTVVSTITVVNVAPTVTLTISASSIVAGTAITSTGEFTDPGVLDTHAMQWNFGDGSPAVSGLLTRIHTFGVAGWYTISFTVTDDDDGVGWAALTLRVVPQQTGPTRVFLPIIRTPPRIRWTYLPLILNNFCMPVTQYADIALAIDVSGSMAQPISPGGPTKLAAAKSAAASFLQQLAFPGDQAAIISFGDGAILEQALSADLAGLTAAVQSLQSGGLTRIDLAFALSSAELTGARHQLANSRVIILLTDGRPNGTTEQEVLTQANAAKAAGITIYTIGLGDNVNAALLQQAASSPERYYFSPTTEELAGIYAQIAEIVRCY